MVIKIMDAGDIRTWRGICMRVEEACQMADSAPKILEEGEEFDDEILTSIRSLQHALTAVEEEGLYPAYIPGRTL